MKPSDPGPGPPSPPPPPLSDEDLQRLTALGATFRRVIALADATLEILTALLEEAVEEARARGTGPADVRPIRPEAPGELRAA